MTALSLLIQDQIETRIAPLSDESLSLGGDPYGGDSRVRVMAQHWIAYQGSSYPQGDVSIPVPEATWKQTRELKYQHYVEFKDLRREYQSALELHEKLMALIAGFRPNVAAVRSPFRVTEDAPVSAKVEAETVYRYRASYEIRCDWEATPLDNQAPFTPTALCWGLWRSPISQVGAPPPDSVLFESGEIQQEGV